MWRDWVSSVLEVEVVPGCVLMWRDWVNSELGLAVC